MASSAGSHRGLCARRLAEARPGRPRSCSAPTRPRIGPSPRLLPVAATGISAAAAPDKVSRLVDELQQFGTSPQSDGAAGAYRTQARTQRGRPAPGRGRPGRGRGSGPPSEPQGRAAPQHMTRGDLKRFKEVCSELNTAVRADGASLAPRTLVGIVGSLRRAATQAPAGEFRSIATPLLRSTLEAAMHPEGTMAFRGDLASWSMLLHGAAPVYQYAPQQMRKLLDTAMQWIKRHKAEVWALKAGRGGARPLTVSLTLWAYATCDYTGEVTPLTQGVETACDSGVMNAATTRDWATAMWACGKLGINAKYMRTFWELGVVALSEAMRKGTASAKDVSMALYGVAKCGYRPGYKRMVVAAALDSDRTVRGFNDENAASVLWSLAQINTSADRFDEWYLSIIRLREACIRVLQRQVDSGLPTHNNTHSDNDFQSLIVATGALCTLQCYDTNLFTAAISAQRRKAATTAAAAAAAGAAGVADKPGGAGAAIGSFAGTLDSVSLLHTCGHVYPGLAVALSECVRGLGVCDVPGDGWSPPLREMYMYQHPKSSRESRVKTSAQSQNTATGRAVASQDSATTALEPQRALDALRAAHTALYDIRELMCALDTTRVSQWDEQALSNLLYAWALLLPPTHPAPTQSTRTRTGPHTASTSSQAAIGGASDTGQNRGGASEGDGGVDLAGLRDQYLSVGRALFIEASRRVDSTTIVQQRDAVLAADAPRGSDTETDVHGADAQGSNSSSGTQGLGLGMGHSMTQKGDESGAEGGAEDGAGAVSTVFNTAAHGAHVAATGGSGSSGAESVAEADNKGMPGAQGGAQGDGLGAVSTVFNTAGLTQIYTAYLEAYESGVLGDVPVSQTLINAAGTAWRSFTQDAARHKTSNSQTTLARYITELGFTTVTEGRAPCNTTTTPTHTAAHTGTHTGTATDTHTGTAIATNTQGAHAAASTTGQGVATQTEQGRVFEPMLVDIVLTKAPSGQQCCVGVEYDGPDHFVEDGDGMCFYNGPTLLRHRMLRRRLNHLITLSSYEWSHILRGKESVTTDAVGGFEPLTAQEFEGPGKERSMEYLRTLLGPWMGEQETALAVSEPTQTSSLAQVSTTQSNEQASRASLSPKPPHATRTSVSRARQPRPSMERVSDTDTPVAEQTGRRTRRKSDG